MRTLWADIAYSFRILAKNSGLTAIAVLSLAVGLGANVAIFRVTYSALLRLLPVQAPRELVTLEAISPRGLPRAFSFPMYEQLRETEQASTGLIAWSPRMFSVGPEESSKREQGLIVSGNFYTTLGVHAILGRTITPEDDGSFGSAPSPVAVISYGYWQREFGHSETILGKVIVVQGMPFTIVGITPPEFFGLLVGDSADIVVPIHAFIDSKQLEQKKVVWLQILARLKRGLSVEQANVQLQSVWPQVLLQTVSPEYSGPQREGFLAQRLRLESASTGLSWIRQQVTQPLKVLTAIAGFVLLMACANLTNLLLARSTSRRKEVAVRLVLGASHWQVFRLLLTEYLLLAGTGAALALPLSYWASRLLVHSLSIKALDVRLDLVVLVFVVCLALVTGILLALGPAFHAIHVNLNAAMKRGTQSPSGTIRAWRPASIVVVLQIAVSMLLLNAAGLLVRTFQKLNGDWGFQPDGVLLMTLAPQHGGYGNLVLAEYYQELVRRVSSLPSVTSASIALTTPMVECNCDEQVTVGGLPPGTHGDASAKVNYIGPRYFETLGTALLRGHDFSSHDTENSTRVALINEAFMRRILLSGDPLGRVISIGADPQRQTIQIIGIVKNSKFQAPREHDEPAVYLLGYQYPKMLGGMVLVVRSSLDARLSADAIRREVVSMGVELPFKTTTLLDQVDQSVEKDRLVAGLSSLFSIVALFLACLGLWGVVAYAVRNRTRELAVRVALGAQRSNVLWLFLREMLIVLAVGVAIGLPSSLAATRLLSTTLFGLSPTDPLSLAIATFGVFLVGVPAVLVPIRRATNLDPMTALRDE